MKKCRICNKPIEVYNGVCDGCYKSLKKERDLPDYKDEALNYTRYLVDQTGFRKIVVLLEGKLEQVGILLNEYNDPNIFNQYCDDEPDNRHPMHAFFEKMEKIVRSNEVVTGTSSPNPHHRMKGPGPEGVGLQDKVSE